MPVDADDSTTTTEAATAVANEIIPAAESALLAPIALTNTRTLKPLPSVPIVSPIDSEEEMMEKVSQYKLMEAAVDENAEDQEEDEKREESGQADESRPLSPMVKMASRAMRDVGKITSAMSECKNLGQNLDLVSSAREAASSACGTFDERFGRQLGTAASAAECSTSTPHGWRRPVLDLDAFACPLVECDADPRTTMSMSRLDGFDGNCRADPRRHGLQMSKAHMCVMSRENFSIEDLVEELEQGPDRDPPTTHAAAGSELGCSQLSSLIRSNEDLGDAGDDDDSTDLVSSGALFAQLAHEMTTPEPCDAVVELILSSLEMCHRRGGRFVKRSVKAVGRRYSFEIPCAIITKYAAEPKDVHAANIVCLTVRLFAHYMTASSVVSAMAESYEVIRALAQSLHCPNASVVIAAVDVLAELAYCEERTSAIIHVDGLLDSLVECGGKEHVNEAVRMGCTRTFLNLATVVECRVMLGARGDVISFLLGCLRESSDRTRKFAIGALGNIAACTVNKLKLVEHENGEVVKYLLFITRLDLIEALRKDAVSVLANLLDEKTSPILCHYPEFLSALVNEATADDDEDIQFEVLKLLRRLGSFVDATSSGHPLLIKALRHSLAGGTANVGAYIVSIIKDQASRPWNRMALAYTPGLLDTIARISMGEHGGDGAAAASVRAFLYISYFEDGATFEANTLILQALTRAAGMTKRRDVLTRYAAIKTLKKLAAQPHNRKLMRKDDALLFALKWAVKKRARVVAVTDALTELFASSTPDEAVEILFEAFDEDVAPPLVGDEDLAALATGALGAILYPNRRRGKGERGDGSASVSTWAGPGRKKKRP